MNQDLQNRPSCIGFIMDGNRRFARERGESTFSGHLAGKIKMEEVMAWSKTYGIKQVVFYAFSTENWQRSKEEVDGLLGILHGVIDDLRVKGHEANYRIRFIGRLADFGEELVAKMRAVEAETAKPDSDFTVFIALSYGGRAEIIGAVNELIKKGEEVTEFTFKNALWSADLIDPDLIIRTGGEQRLSNFLTWQSVYSELFFTKTHWPAFTKEEFEGILDHYAARERRRGK